MAIAKLPPLRELRFGELDASEEAVVSPNLLLRGYFDFREAAYSIASRAAWVLLGPKGAGKSAVLEYLRLSWADRPDRFMTYWELDTFPVNDVTSIDMGLKDGTARVRAAWELLLLLRVIESVDRDPDADRGPHFNATVSALEAYGYLGADLRTVVLDLARLSAGLNVRVASASAEVATSSPRLPDMPVMVKEGLSNVELRSQHLVALDGLDSFFFEGGAGWQSLSGLVDALASVNRFLMEAGLPVSVVVTLRSDYFDALNSQNSNKLKSRVVYLDWTAGGIGSKNALWGVMSKKASVGRPEVTDVVRQYLSEPVPQPAFPTVAEYLLSYTRLLPRDMVSIMSFVQEAHPGSSPVTSEHAKEAARRFSEEYFVGEMMNNLSGVLTTDRAHSLVAFREALRAAPNRFITMDYLLEELEGELDRAEIKALLRRMFETGCVGISNPDSSGRRFTDFIFRRVSGAAFTTRYEFMLHDALTRAWNRRWRS
jgi:hypothetical protein